MFWAACWGRRSFLFSCNSRDPAAWSVWKEGGRLAALGGDSIVLVVGSVLLALPLGIAGAFVLNRTWLPWKGFFRFLTLLALFIPLPLYASAWQVAFSSANVFAQRLAVPSPQVTDVALLQVGRPWSVGLTPAILVHAVAAVPWVVVLLGLGLRAVEPELEEDAILATNPWTVFWRFTLPRLLPWLVAATVWVGLIAFTEITVADMAQVRTLAEEVYTQSVMGDADALARATAVAVPPALLIALLVMLSMTWWERSLPANLDSPAGARWILVPGKAWVWFLVAGTAAAFFLGIPLESLVWKLGEILRN